MRTRLAVLPLLAAVLVSPLLAGCSDEPQTSVTDDGVIETPTPGDGGAGLDARSGDPLAPSDPTTQPSVQASRTP